MKQRKLQLREFFTLGEAPGVGTAAPAQPAAPAPSTPAAPQAPAPQKLSGNLAQLMNQAEDLLHRVIAASSGQPISNIINKFLADITPYME